MPTDNLSSPNYFNYQNNTLFPKSLNNIFKPTNFSTVKCPPVQPKMNYPLSNPITKPTIMPM
jgi:hypothetical protein